MKMLPYFLINLAVVGGGLFLYDHYRGEAPVGSGALGDGVDLADVDARIDERLAGREQPTLRMGGTDPRVLDRIAALEAQLGAPTPAPRAPLDGQAGDAPSDGEGFARPDPLDVGEEPTEEEVRRFRRIMERAERMRREERELATLDRVLERLEITLDDGQKEKLLEAQRSHRRRVGETWRAAFRDGGGRDAAQAAVAELREAFTAEISKFMSVGDAQKISENGAGMMRRFGGLRGRAAGGRSGRDGR